VQDVKSWQQNARPKCGNCQLWMTRSCPQENHSNMTGYSKGPSCNGIPCEKYRENYLPQELIQLAEASKAAGRAVLEGRQFSPWPRPKNAAL
jgi:hypothetical protein